VDETTRYLCAAAHTDPEFADAAIAEFLIEPLRAVPPSPGLDTVAVLRDAVAARHRRLIRDALLLALLAVFVFWNAGLVVGWFAVALAWHLLTRSSRTQSRKTEHDRHRRRTTALVAGVVVAVVIALAVLSQPGVPFLLWLALSGGSGVTGTADEEWLLTTAVPVMAMFAVLLADQVLVRRLLQVSFQKEDFTPVPTRPGSVEYLLRTCGLQIGTYTAQLRRIAQATAKPDTAEVIVHRGFDPFVGAGRIQRIESIALPLTPPSEEERRESSRFADIGGAHGERVPRPRPAPFVAEADGALLTADRPAEPRPFTAVELLDSVSAEMNGLRSSGSLTPSHRLHELRIRHQLIVPADRLIANRDDQTHVTVLEPRQPPVPHLPLLAARVLADRPLEWLRYYECYQVESWDRELVVSCFLHVGLSRNMLYLEWVPYVLYPIKKRYKDLDRAPEESPLGFVDALAELVRLPAAVVEKAARFRPPARMTTSMTPARYGSLYSLRELATDPEPEHYFQGVDVGRYVKVLSERMTRAVGRFLEDRGYAVDEFVRQAASVVNNVNYGTMINSAQGSGNAVAQNTTTTNTGTATGRQENR
jgi:hypothetical protein